jgi:hypothetical protein
MKRLLLLAAVCFFAAQATAQIQVGLKFKRLEYIAYEPVLATLVITNLAGRDIDLHDDGDQRWFGFELTVGEGRGLGPLTTGSVEPPLRIAAGETVTRKINLTPLYPINEFGVYHVRANVFFADLNKYFYSQTKVFEITDARPIWQRTVGLPDGSSGGGVRTMSLLSNRFPDHTSLYVRVEDKSSNLVYATYSLGRVIAFDEPHAELDRENRLHVLQCSAPRTWGYSVIGLNGELLSHATYLEAKSIPRLRRNPDGSVVVLGGLAEAAVAQSAKQAAPKLSERPAGLPKNE